MQTVGIGPGGFVAHIRGDLFVDVGHSHIHVYTVVSVSCMDLCDSFRRVCVGKAKLFYIDRVVTASGIQLYIAGTDLGGNVHGVVSVAGFRVDGAAFIQFQINRVGLRRADQIQVGIGHGDLLARSKCKAA